MDSDDQIRYSEVMMSKQYDDKNGQWGNDEIQDRDYRYTKFCFVLERAKDTFFKKKISKIETFLRT